MQEQRITTDISAIPIVVATTSCLDCAWCLSEQGIPAGERSHGCCAKHRAQILAQHHAIRAAQAQKSRR